MPAQISFLRALLDALGCMGLGFCVSALRAVLPGRRGKRWTFAADFLATVAALLLAQAYAAQRAAAGELRWYMLAALLLGAVAAQSLLAPVFRSLRNAAAWPVRRAVNALLGPIGRQWGRLQKNRSENRQKAARKNLKKQLPNEQRVLYNSNVS